MLIGPDCLVALYMPCDGTQDDPLHNFPWHRGQADRPVVPRILLLALLVDGASHLLTSSHLGPPQLARTAADK